MSMLVDGFAALGRMTTALSKSTDGGAGLLETVRDTRALYAQHGPLSETADQTSSWMAGHSAFPRASSIRPGGETWNAISDFRDARGAIAHIQGTGTYGHPDAIVQAEARSIDDWGVASSQALDRIERGVTHQQARTGAVTAAVLLAAPAGAGVAQLALSVAE